jgi:hypothetical protein
MLPNKIKIKVKNLFLKKKKIFKVMRKVQIFFQPRILNRKNKMTGNKNYILEFKIIKIIGKIKRIKKVIIFYKIISIIKVIKIIQAKI